MTKTLLHILLPGGLLSRVHSNGPKRARTQWHPWACFLAMALVQGHLPGQALGPVASAAPAAEQPSHTNRFGMSFVKIPPGSFWMEAAPGQSNASRVTIPKAFYLQTTEVTQGQWKAVMGTAPWQGKEHVREGDDFPAVGVSWEDVQAFLRKLNRSGEGRYRLPTEAEWEYACRAATTTKYSFGDDPEALENHAWFGANTFDAGEPYAHRVGTRRVNPWGLFDMHGNVWEWCQNSEGKAPTDARKHALRGGAWYGTAMSCQSGDRCTSDADSRDAGFGFRVLVVIPPGRIPRDPVRPK